MEAAARSISPVRRTEQTNKAEPGSQKTAANFEHLASNLIALKEALVSDHELLDKRDENGNTLLHLIASKHQDLHVFNEFTLAVKPYLNEARVTAKDSKGNMVLHLVIQDKDLFKVRWESVKIYLEHATSDTLYIENNECMSALLLCYMNPTVPPKYTRHVTSTQLLRSVFPAVDLNKKCEYLDLSAEWTFVAAPLFAALAQNNYIEVLSLLEAGASPRYLGHPADINLFKELLDKRIQAYSRLVDRANPNDNSMLNLLTSLEQLKDIERQTRFHDSMPHCDYIPPQNRFYYGDQ